MNSVRRSVAVVITTATVEDAYDGDDGVVYSTNDVDLKAHSHCGDINETSCQFIVLLEFSSVAAM